MAFCPHFDLSHGHVTLDWDGATSPPRRFYLYGGLDSSEVLACVHWRRSSSRKGLHVMVCLKGDMTPIEKFMFRMWNHDDIWRISYDMLRWQEAEYVHATSRQYSEGTLFDWKNGKEADKWHD